MKKEVIIDTKRGKVTEESKDDLVCLKGDKFNEDSNFIENLCILIKSDDIGEKEYPLKLGGYNFKLYLGSLMTALKIYLYMEKVEVVAIML